MIAEDGLAQENVPDGYDPHRPEYLGRDSHPSPAGDVRMEHSLTEHKHILAAIANRNADDARAAMRAHLATIEGYLRQYSKTLGASASGAT